MKTFYTFQIITFIAHCNSETSFEEKASARGASEKLIYHKPIEIP